MVDTLGLKSIKRNISDVTINQNQKDIIEKKYKECTDKVLNDYNNSAGRLPLSKFEWGSNGFVATAGSILGIGYNYFKKEKNAINYLNASQYCFDYLLGQNATGYSFVTGFGTKYPRDVHDRRIKGGGIDEPIPGYLCGGPGTDSPSDCGEDNYPSKFPAKSYLDKLCSFSTNEIAINWNAPLVLLTSIMQNEK